MKNHVQPGIILALVAPTGGVVAGLAYVIGSLVAVAATTAAQTEPFEGVTEGVISLPKAGGGGIAFTAGEKVFWDNTAKLCKKTASGYFMIGTAIAAAVDAETAVRVRLDGIAVTAVP